ncbi:hypothetical protein chiPu_0007249 [Chiloscyllium punctatum]|uniref:Uncharacterized protein n=1 Tax=Chiloscyllium punctatum TaxID=137246 RepID=A0A401SEI2_CHIPU|nr:hypothetical protein [Chiloscyllium punctatum]
MASVTTGRSRDPSERNNPVPVMLMIDTVIHQCQRPSLRGRTNGNPECLGSGDGNRKGAVLPVRESLSCGGWWWIGGWVRQLEFKVDKRFE